MAVRFESRDHRRIRPVRRWAAATAVAAAAVLLGAPLPAATADSSPGPPVTLPDGQKLSCPPETFPAAGAPRSAASTPYEIPFTATLGQKSPLGVPEGGT